MTIVLQHQFWDLNVSESHFSVTLSFSGVHHNLNIPFSAVTHFNDPSVGFGLQFGEADEGIGDDDLSMSEAESKIEIDKGLDPNDRLLDKQGNGTLEAPKHEQREDTSIGQINDDGTGSGADVVSLDTFRKKPN